MSDRNEQSSSSEGAEHPISNGTDKDAAAEHRSPSDGQHELQTVGLSNTRIEGSAGDDLLIPDSQSDRGVNILDGGNGDDILVAGGSATPELSDFLRSHQEVTDTIHTDSHYAGLRTLVDTSAASEGAFAAQAPTAGAVANTFTFHSGSGHDAIYNFHAHGDKIQIDRGINGTDITDLDSLLQHVTVSGNDVSIDFGQGNVVTLVGVDVAHLTPENVAWG